ncbi:MAG: ComEC/Rec2 family competence protein [Dysgonamonadaceae bacterium]|jgi:competence protein ComEC|nr:ComEC/Rec2 family competence protein [Dysgonamonadaceae bacterium]
MTVKTLYKSVFLRLTLFLIPGIIIQTYRDCRLIWLITAALAIAMMAVSFLPRISKIWTLRYLFGVGAALLCLSVGGLLARVAWTKSEWPAPTGFAQYRVLVLSEAVKKPKTWMYKAKVDDRQVVVYLSAAPDAVLPAPGDCLKINTRFEPASEWYLRRQKIAARAFVKSGNWEILPEKSGFNLVFTALKCRRVLLERLRKICSDEQKFAVASALMLGYTGELDAETRQTFAATGSSHILSVSGLHVSIVYGILFFLFSFLGNSRKAQITRQLIILPIVWAFAFICGLGPPVVRAAIVLTMLGLGFSLLLRSFSVNNLSQAAFFMLLYNPLYLFNIGFQLSFAATYAILIINPALQSLVQSRNPLVNYAWQLSSVSVSAQLGTAPLSLYYFGQFPLLFLATNLFAIPLTGLLLALLPLTMALNFAFPRAEWLLIPINKALDAFISGLQWLESVPRGLVSEVRISVFETAVFALFIVFFYLLLTRRRAIFLYMLLLLLAVGMFV